MPDSRPGALDRALRYLTRRAYATAELKTKLLAAGHPYPEVRDALRELERMHLLDDRQLAEDRAAALGQRGYGLRRIENDLRKRRLAQLLPEEQREALRLDEPQRALAAAEFKLRLLSREPDPRKRREKLLRFLFARGFSPEAAFGAADQLLGSD